MPTARQKRDRNSGLVRFATTQVAVVGWLAMTISSAQAAYDLNYYPFSYLNAEDFRACAARLLSVNISPSAAASACSQALRPRSVSSCVVDIKRQTSITAVDALATCTQARRPSEVASCVVGISRSSKGQADPTALNYCGRTLLPVRFGDCVVGLRSATDIAPTQAMNSCINATDLLFDLAPNFIPQNGTPAIPSSQPGIDDQSQQNQPIPLPGGIRSTPVIPGGGQ